MSNIIDFQQKSELIKTARRQLYAEYLNCQKTGYNTWVTEADVARRTSKSMPGSPLLKPFPTETDVISKALELYNNINGVTGVAAAVPAPPKVATYLDKIHEVYTTPIVLLGGAAEDSSESEPAPDVDTASEPEQPAIIEPEQPAIIEPEQPAIIEPEQPSISEQLAAAYYGDPVYTSSISDGEMSIAAQLSEVYHGNFTDPVSVLLDTLAVPADEEIPTTDTFDLVETLPAEELETTAESTPSTDILIVKSESAVNLETIAEQIANSLQETGETGKSNRSTLGIQQLIAKLLKTDQQGKHNV